MWRICQAYVSRIWNEHDGWAQLLSWTLNQKNKQGIFINQSKYTKEIARKFGLENAKSFSTPMSSSSRLDNDEKGMSVDQKLYKGMIGSLHYITASGADIMFSVCLCARYQSNPKECHLKGVKKIIRYLNGTQNVGLWYDRESTLVLNAYSDSDYAGCKIDRKSTNGVCQFLGCNLISWLSGAHRNAPIKYLNFYYSKVEQ